ncbi:uncharacterized protein [Hetaerina americana]|uniref:uncharacterized protein n=1 Tax=Hetaerina americana TaxID=62018 RepID=UPI003A7F2BCB
MTMTGKEEHVFRSSFADMVKEIVVPNVSYPTFAFDCIRKNLKFLGDRAAAVDAVRGQHLLYKDVEPLAVRFASALTRKGFEKGDVMFYVTYNAALLFALQFGVWLCGGAVKGCFQKEDADEMERQMMEVKCRFILCEPETAELVKAAAGRLGWPVHYLSIDGAVEGASSVEVMASADDGSAYNKDVPIDPEEDILLIPSTSGSTGSPKGALHTHRNLVILQASLGAPLDLEREDLGGETLLWVNGNFNVGPSFMFQNSVMLGNTYVSISKFKKDSYFRFIDYHKPTHLGLYPYVANIVASCPEMEVRDFSFIKSISLVGSVVGSSTIENLSKYFLQAKFEVIYGMTETLIISSHRFGLHHKILRDPVMEARCKVKLLEVDGEVYVSCGQLYPLVEAKILDVESGNALGSGSKGRILVRSPYIMKGYIKSASPLGYQSSVDEHGWLDTGDYGFIDEDGHIYIIERLKMIFKYLMHHVSPADIERVILEHQSVESVGVVGVPDPKSTSAAKAYIVIKPGCCTTEEEIKKHVADNMPFYKHLHGGVVFTDVLPESTGGKVDRAVLLSRAIQDSK